MIDELINKPIFIKCPFIKKEDIEYEASQILQQGDFFLKGRLDFKELCVVISEKYHVRFVFDKDLIVPLGSSPLLGKILFSPLTIFVTKVLENDICRGRFTLAHEIGHLILHMTMLKNFLEQYDEFDEAVKCGNELPGKLNKSLEIQANIFASRLLLPQNLLLKELYSYYVENELIQSRPLYLDFQQCNQLIVNSFLEKARRKFLVSKEAIKYRLIDLKLLIDDTTSCSVFSVK